MSIIAACCTPTKTLIAHWSHRILNDIMLVMSASASTTVDRDRLSIMVNNMADGVLAIDTSGTIDVYNGAALNILDTNANLSGKSIYSYLQLVDSNNKKVDLAKLLQRTKISTVYRDYRIKYSDSDFADLHININPIKSNYDKLSGYVIMFHDITKEKSLEEERNEFISVVSHELRTPVTIAEGNISNAQYIASREHLSDNITHALHAAHDQVVFLSSMINDLSTLSRAERGRLSFEVEDINIYSVLQSLHEEYSSQARQKRLNFNLYADPNLELIKSNKLYIREILQNFITNAIKYTQKGSVTISATQHPKGITIDISDTGIGINTSDQAKLFTKFFRSEDYRTRETTGTGLGLYVSKKLAKLIKGEITFSSQVNHGSTFSIFIPNLKSQ